MWTLGSSVVVTLMSLVGLAFLAWGRDHLDRLLLYLVSLAAGVLLGAAVFHLIPEAIAALGGEGLELPLLFLAGFLGFFFLERFLWAHHHGHGMLPASREATAQGHHGGEAHGGPPAARPHPVVFMNLLGSGLHHLMDGMIIAAAYLAGPGISLGLVTTGAVLLHAIPHEAGDFGILVRGGLEVRRAILLNLLSTSATLVGAVAVLAAGSLALGFSAAILPITAGNFIYIAAADLIPELRHHHDRRESAGHAALLVVGVLLMLALRLAGFE